ncbi:flavodoxin family protein [Ruminiclostridium cellulolyticum]|uniref:NADPH-dependent FMN reductase n=1 Tax=Ruminiclostridium cellulolyticum (strain ATCC 35319 / DSM 5812 / JCM 6584 / H10) TaxID=394503 RepID=B8I4Z9_RUMCH|nr:NAD(P)H-dependent oxidoreductase [Ruminiclostridium cellulolyticum]ACL74579.1 NADPH-dependent FMN reductase [Ruminiclostridium cellulolyticum H10]
MKVVVLHGSPRKGNTYLATSLFLDELRKCGGVDVVEFFLQRAMPEFCTGCQLCLGNPNEKCPHARYVTPILDAILKADALIFTTPHFGACSMSGIMKNLLDHLDFLTMNVSPRKEIFRKKAFVISTGAGSTAAIKPIKSYLKNWGINRVYTCGIRMFTNKWSAMPVAKQRKFERMLCKAAQHFYAVPKRHPYLSTVFMYYMSKFILKKFVGVGNYPYEYWNKNGYFTKCPF